MNNLMDKMDTFLVEGGDEEKQQFLKLVKVEFNKMAKKPVIKSLQMIEKGFDVYVKAIKKAGKEKQFLSVVNKKFRTKYRNLDDVKYVYMNDKPKGEGSMEISLNEDTLNEGNRRVKYDKIDEYYAFQGELKKFMAATPTALLSGLMLTHQIWGYIPIVSKFLPAGVGFSGWTYIIGFILFLTTVVMMKWIPWGSLLYHDDFQNTISLK